jgi:hypothetical protein
MAYRSTTHNKDFLGAVAGHTPALIIDILGMRPMAVIGGVLVDMLFSHARMILFARRTGSTQPRPQGLVIHRSGSTPTIGNSSVNTNTS